MLVYPFCFFLHVWWLDDLIIELDYSQVMDIVDRLFVTMFDELNEKCKKELEAIGKQYPFQSLKVINLESSISYKFHNFNLWVIAAVFILHSA